MSKIQYTVLSFLPPKLNKAIVKLGLDNVSEIRIRSSCPVLAIKGGKKVFLDKFTLSSIDIEEIILSVCKHSIYSFDEQIKQGYVTSDFGLRIGLSGEATWADGKISTIKNVNSICIRIPRFINGVSFEFFNKIYRGGSVLIISPPGVGKTTFLRDFTKNISSNFNKNVVVVDERNEIACKTGNNVFNLGNTVDVLTYFDKTFGLNQALRTLNPEVLVVDELVSKTDVNGVISTVFGGVDVIATAHASSIVNLFSREFGKKIKEYKPFDYYVLISYKNNDRKYSYYDKEFKLICL